MEQLNINRYENDCCEWNTHQASKMKKFFLVVLLFTTIINISFLLKAKAQMVTCNNALISSTSAITINGDVLLNTNAGINNNGTIDLKGEWENNSGNNCFGLSHGLVKLTGTNQMIGGTSPTLFNSLLLQGTGTVKLNQHALCGGGYLNPAGVFNLGNQLLDLNSHTLTVTNPDGNALTTSTGFILSEKTDNSSKVTWQINNTIGAHVVLFGNNLGEYIPLTFNLTNGNAADVTFSTYATNPANQPLPTSPDSVTNINNSAAVDNSANMVDRFWHIEKSGINCNANITFTYGNSEVPANGNFSIVAQNWNPILKTWNPPLLIQSNPTITSVLITNMQAFGTYALTKLNNPLPIALLRYDTKPIGNIVRNSWITSSETENDYFTIERSSDAQHFMAIGRLEGAGTSYTSKQYIFDDLNPLAGTNYYRLKQTDINGTYTYSDVRKVYFEIASSFQIEVFPNPTTDFVTVSSNMKGTNDIALYDGNGRILKVMNTTTTISKIDMSNLPSGNYYLQIKNEDNIQSAKITKL
ncbi:MAG: T9SS type A sorting domain-containing protein [Bacteroidetes bacterium]|nr:T9SS type A sorting domain-containing protein [Bacteroidota bacterium]